MKILRALKDPRSIRRYCSSPLQLIADREFSHGFNPLRLGNANITIMIVRNKMKVIDKQDVYFSASRLSKHESGATIKNPKRIQNGLCVIAALV